MSRPDIANQPDAFEWNASLFGPVLYHLPGVDPADLCEVTYPRFLVAHDHLLFECRIGMAGEGSDVLYRYEPSLNKFNFIATYLRGIKNNPYIHGLSFEPGRSRIHVSWMYREYVYVDKSTSAHRQQAGPNGPENNRDLAYAYSDDYGETWHNSEGVSLGAGSITPHSPGIVVHRMPCGSGLLNSEGQCVDRDGNFHILSRDGIRTGQLEWRHIMRDARTGTWTTETIPTVEPTSIGRRGKICSDPITGNVFFIVPGNKDDSLTILVREKIPGQGSGSFTDILPRYSLAGMDGEPLVDEQRLLAGNGVLSIFTRTAEVPRGVVVVDLCVSDPPAESTGPP